MYIFLDHIRTTLQDNPSHQENNPLEENWRSTLIQPIKIPDLEHLTVKHSIFAPHEEIWRPDGSISRAFRDQILNHVTASYMLPSSTFKDEKDMKNRDNRKQSYEFKQNIEQQIVTRKHSFKFRSHDEKKCNFDYS